MGNNQRTSNTSNALTSNVPAGTYLVTYTSDTDKASLYYTTSNHTSGTKIVSGEPFTLSAAGCIYVRVNNGITGTNTLTFEIYAGDTVEMTANDKVAREDLSGFKAKIDPMINSVYAGCGLREIAHQGYNDNAPSNSIRAYQDACALGAWGVNTAQIRHSADGTLWIMHDPDVDSTTDGTGSIGSLTDAYLETLHINGTGTDADRKIPKLEEVLQLCCQYGTIPMLRFATAGSGKFSYNAYDEHYAELFRLIKKYGLSDKVMFSAEKSAIAVIDQYFPKALKVAFTSNSTTVQDMVTSLNTVEWYSKGTVIAMINATLITDATASTAYNAGYGLYASNADDLVRLSRLGVSFYNSAAYVSGFVSGVMPTIRKVITELAT